ncbi:unnamed protein product [Choristocarpus tenellus]
MSRITDRKVVGLEIVFKGKVDEDGKVVRYECYFLAQGFWQTPELDYTEKFVPTTSAAGIEDLELRHLVVEQALIQASVEEDIFIELSEQYRKFPGAVEKLNCSIYG